MKKFFQKLAAFLLLLALPWVGYFCYIQSLAPAYGNSLMGGTHYKMQLAATTPGPRILFVGGSGAPYSVVCAEVETALGMPCLNLGTTAYLGLEFYLAQLRSYLQAGDIIILAPEYSMLEQEVSSSLVWMAVENHSQLLRNVPLSYLPGMVQTFLPYARDKRTMLAGPHAPVGTPQEQYAAAGFGPMGDITFARENILENGYNTEDCRAISANTVDTPVLRSVQRFAKEAHRKGATVYLTYAPFNRLAVLPTPDDPTGANGIAALQRRLDAAWDLPWLGTLADGIWDEAYFYDSNNHLNSAGAALRTADLIARLQEVLS